MLMQLVLSEKHVTNSMCNCVCFRCGRKITVVGSMALASVACIAVAFIPTDKGQGTSYMQSVLFRYYNFSVIVCTWSL